MANGKTKADRSARERARVYEARKGLHDAQHRRRRRDNTVVSIAGGLVLLAAFGAQAAFYGVGPGVAEPTPEPTTQTGPAPLPFG